MMTEGLDSFSIPEIDTFNRSLGDGTILFYKGIQLP